LKSVRFDFVVTDDLWRYALIILFPFAPLRETNGTAFQHSRRQSDKQQKTARELAGAVAASPRCESAKVD